MIENHFIEDCIFCKILRGQIPSFRIFDDEKTFAFMDINPINEGHALVIPKYHSENLYLTPDKWLGSTMSTARKIAAAVNKVIEPAGINLLQANGPGAKQSVFHFHIHVIPRYMDDGVSMNWETVPGDTKVIEMIAKKLVAALD